MPLDLSGALPQKNQITTTQVKSDYGIHDGFWVGLGEPFTEVSFSDPCRRCKGKKTDEHGNLCAVCDGKGKRIDQKVALLYDLENGNREEEIVNYALTPPRTGKDGQPLSPSTMFLRFRMFSGGLATVEEISQWAANLPAKIRVPVQLVIEDNAKGTALKITKVLKRNPNGQPPQQKQRQSEDGYNFPDQEL